MNRRSKAPCRVKAISYEPRMKLLTVEFDDGQVYRYRQVPRAVYDALRVSMAEIHFQRHIKDR